MMVGEVNTMKGQRGNMSGERRGGWRENYTNLNQKSEMVSTRLTAKNYIVKV